MMKYKDVYEDSFDPKAQIYHVQFDAKNNTYFADVYNANIIFSTKISEETRVILNDGTSISSKTLTDDFLENAYKVSGKNYHRKPKCFDNTWFVVCKNINIEDFSVLLNNLFILNKTDEANTFAIEHSAIHAMAYVFKTNTLLCSAFILCVAIFIKVFFFTDTSGFYN